VPKCYENKKLLFRLKQFLVDSGHKIFVESW
jgi:hypothetical protein